MGIGIDLPTFIGQLVSFLVLLTVLSYLGYRPLRRALEARSQRIRATLEEAEFTRIEYERTRAQAREELGKARKEAHQILVNAGAARDRLLREAESEARDQARTILEEARERACKERESMLEAVRQRFADSAISVAELIILESLDKERHRNLIDRALKEALPLSEDEQRSDAQ